MLIEIILGAVIVAVVVLFAWAAICVRRADGFERDIVRLDDEAREIRITIENLYMELKEKRIV